MPGSLHTLLPAPLANSVYVLIFILLCFWLLKALRRFLRTVVLRRAMANGSVVQIQGLGNYLTYFDGATRAHLNSVVQTRQPKAPVPMDVVFVPCYLRSIQLTANASNDRFVLEVNMYTNLPGKLYLLTKFDTKKFIVAIRTIAKKQQEQPHTQYVDKYNIGNQILKDIVFHSERNNYSTGSNSSSASGSFNVPYLSDKECCLSQCWIQECPRIGEQMISVAILSPSASTTAGNSKSQFNVALCFIPDLPKETASLYQVHKDGSMVDELGHRASSSYSAVLYDEQQHRDRSSYDESLSMNREGQGLLQARHSFTSSQQTTNISVSQLHPSPHLHSHSGSNHAAFSTSIPSSPPRLRYLRSWLRYFRSWLPYNSHNDSDRQHSGDTPLQSPLNTDPLSPPVPQQDTAASAAGEQQQRPILQHDSSAAAAAIYVCRLPVHLRNVFKDTTTAATTTATIASTPALRPHSAHSPDRSSIAADRDTTPLLRHQQQQQASASASTASAVPSPAPAHLLQPSSAATIRRKDIYPRELLTIDEQGIVYTSQEIFGMSGMNDNNNSKEGEGDSSNSVPSGGLSANKDADNVSVYSARSVHVHVVPPSSSLIMQNASRVSPAVGGGRGSLGMELTDFAVADPPPSSSSSIAESKMTGGVGGDDTTNAASSPAIGTENSNTAAAAATGDDNGGGLVGANSLILSQGGKYTQEECVICMTDPKEILLLPCRHLCVCTSCFVFVDKCPVCRAFFDEYVTIQSQPKLNLSTNVNLRRK